MKKQTELLERILFEQEKQTEMLGGMGISQITKISGCFYNEEQADKLIKSIEEVACRKFEEKTPCQQEPSS